MRRLLLALLSVVLISYSFGAQASQYEGQSLGLISGNSELQQKSNLNNPLLLEQYQGKVSKNLATHYSHSSHSSHYSHSSHSSHSSHYSMYN